MAFGFKGRMIQKAHVKYFLAVLSLFFLLSLQENIPGSSALGAEEYVFIFPVDETWNLSNSIVRISLNQQMQDFASFSLLSDAFLVVDVSQSNITLEQGTLYVDVIADEGIVASRSLVILESVPVDEPSGDLVAEIQPVEDAVENISGVAAEPYSIDQDQKVKTSIKELTKGKDKKETVPVLIKIKANKNEIEQSILSSGSALWDTSDNNIIAAELEIEDFDNVSLDDDVLEIWPDRKTQVFLNESVYQIHADSLWNIGLNGSGIKVAILDTGVENPNVVAETDFTGIGVDDRNGHGSFVATVLTAVAPSVQIYSGKVLDDSGSGQLSWLINGIDWAMANDVDVISLSLGATYTENSEELLSAPEVLKVEEAIANGITVVIASGNCRSGCGSFYGVTTPGIAEHAVTVGAVDDTNTVASFSSGDVINGYIKPDLVAPGVGICSGSLCYSGTSISTPHVAGGVALLLQNNSMPPALVKDLLENDAVDLGDAGKDVYYGSGLLDLSGIFGAPSVSVEKPRNYTLSIPSLSVGQESEFVLVFNNTESENRKITVQWDFEEFDVYLSHSVKNTIPAKKTKRYTYSVMPSVPGLHMLHIDISEEGTVLYDIDRVVMVGGNYSDSFTEVQVQYG